MFQVLTGCHHTYILDVIRSYGLVVAVDGTFSYNNNVQPLLTRTVLRDTVATAFEKLEELLVDSDRQEGTFLLQEPRVTL